MGRRVAASRPCASRSRATTPRHRLRRRPDPLEAEVAEFLAKHTDLKTETGQQRVVRHGHLPEREIMTGIGPVAVRQPRVRDREATEGARIRYSPSILPRYARRSQSLEALIPILYLTGP